MSHVVQIQTEVRDVAAIVAACRRLALAEPVYGEAKLFSGARTGWQVLLLDWKYPVVFDVNMGHVGFDDFEGRWGNPQELNRFLQAYAVERAKIEARKQGHSVTEQQLADGSIKLTVQVGGAA
jgi:hypothetical protein